MRSDKLLGTCEAKLLPLETKAVSDELFMQQLNLWLCFNFPQLQVSG